MTKIKICGITNYDDAKAAIDLGADALGYNFYAKSPRCVTTAEAQAIVRRLPPSVWHVGVFVNHARSEVETIARTVGLDTLQFHGDESVEHCAGWMSWRVIRAVRCEPKLAAEEIARYKDAADFLLLDGFRADSYGGTGEVINTALLEKLRQNESWLRTFLAGGLTPENVGERVKSYKPFGVDVASGVESSDPRKKDRGRLKAFINAVRSAG